MPVTTTRPAIDTSGALFNRPQPRGLDGEAVNLLKRNGEESDAKNYVFNKGKDIASVSDRSNFKYRIPATSVVNKVGDLKLFCCLGYRLTAAQWVWLLNLFCFLAHSTGVALTAYFAWFSKDLEARYGKGVNPYEIPIYRIGATWNNDTRAGYNFTFENRHANFDVAWGTISFFALSAAFHLFAVVVGLCECTWFIYWRCARRSCRATSIPTSARRCPRSRRASRFRFVSDNSTTLLLGGGACYTCAHAQPDACFPGDGRARSASLAISLSTGQLHTVTVYTFPVLEDHRQTRGVAQWTACWAHNPEVAGSKPASARQSFWTRAETRSFPALPLPAPLPFSRASVTAPLPLIADGSSIRCRVRLWG